MFYSQTEVWSYEKNNVMSYLGKSFPFCEATVADLASTPPDADWAILLMAAEDPVRGPDAL